MKPPKVTLNGYDDSQISAATSELTREFNAITFSAKTAAMKSDELMALWRRSNNLGRKILMVLLLQSAAGFTVLP